MAIRYFAPVSDFGGRFPAAAFRNHEHGDRFSVLVAERGVGVVGWTSRIGAEFHKIVLFALSTDDSGRSLYKKLGYRDVGTCKEQRRLDGHFVDVVAMEKLLKPLVLFVCKHNTGRSQMAEAFLRRFVGDDVDVASAGTIAGDRPDPGVVAAMADMGMDISSARPKLLNPVLVARADRIITMACDVQGVTRVDDEWELPDPKGQSPERIREIRDLVCKKAATSRKNCFVRSHNGSL